LSITFNMTYCGNNYTYSGFLDKDGVFNYWRAAIDLADYGCPGSLWITFACNGTNNCNGWMLVLTYSTGCAQKTIIANLTSCRCPDQFDYSISGFDPCCVCSSGIPGCPGLNCGGGTIMVRAARSPVPAKQPRPRITVTAKPRRKLRAKAAPRKASRKRSRTARRKRRK
jgi:hypothetical protein